MCRFTEIVAHLLPSQTPIRIQVRQPTGLFASPLCLYPHSLRVLAPTAALPEPFDASSPFVYAEWFSWCQTCRHGGHADHLTKVRINFLMAHMTRGCSDWFIVKFDRINVPRCCSGSPLIRSVPSRIALAAVRNWTPLSATVQLPTPCPPGAHDASARVQLLQILCEVHIVPRRSANVNLPQVFAVQHEHRLSIARARKRKERTDQRQTQ